MVKQSFFAIAAVAAMVSTASAEGWGTIKGQFVIEGAVPPVVTLAIDQDKVPCLAKGPILSEKYVVNPKNKGVKWVVVWIAPEKNGIADHKTIPEIHPELVKIKDKQIVVDQPCCKFEPHVFVLRKGQDFVGKNSSPIAHAMLIQGQNGVSDNLTLAPGGQLPVAAAKWKPHYYPTSISCGIHPWMNAKMFVIGHPYFAVSDEDGKFEIKNVPAGKLSIIMWHEEGWAHKKAPGKKGFDGQSITVEDGKTLDLGKIAVPKAN